jgi:type IV pilus assembly protein PilW
MNNHCIPAQSRHASTCLRPSDKTQYGMSLIELMIAMTIGLFLVGVVAALFIGSKQTYRSQDNLARLQESGRFAIKLLGKNIREAGYHSINFTPPGTLYDLVQTGDTNAFTGTALDGAEGAAGAADSIITSAEGTVDCLNAAAASPAVNAFSINGSSQLTCLGNGSVTAKVLMDNLEDMQILYGEDFGATRRYVDRSTVADMNNVKTVRICVLLRTAETGLTPAAGQRYTDCAGNLVTKADGRIRHAFSDTLNVRSRNP